MNLNGALKFFFLLFALQFPATNVFAADKLEADLIPLELRARNEAPVPVEVRFKWDSTRILEGRLEMEFREGNRILARYRSGDLALSGDEQKFRMLLPPSLKPYSDSQVEVQMKFVTASGAIELEPSTLYAPTASERSLVIGWCNAVTSAGQSSSEVVQNLLFEHFAPPLDNNIYQRLLMTNVVPLSPEDLPVQPLAYTPFDIIILTPEAFKEAGERQLQALARWVRGGGSVCVFVGDELQPQHIAFLNLLAESTSDSPAFFSDNAGNLLPAQKNILMLHSGVGRSVIVTGENASALSLDTATWRKTATFLWKMRNDQARAIADSGHWGWPTNSSMEDYTRAERYSQAMNNPGEPVSYSVQPTMLGGELLARLMPTTVRLIPFSSLIGMLAVFVLLIGPADYFLLGFLRRRRLTWILFPATSIAFTVVMVLMANHYLGLRDQRRSLIVVDLDKNGNALRWNRYELVFAARDKQSVTELKDALWSPLNVQTIPEYYAPSGRSYGYGQNLEREVEPPLYDGTLPVRFQTSENIRQWQPQLNRFFSFEPPPVPLPSNWHAIETALPDLEKVRAKLAEEKFINCDVCSISRSPSSIANIANQEPYGISRANGLGILPDSILGKLCVADSAGLQLIVSQISPTGGGNFEDAPAMDAEGNDSVLAIVTNIGDDIVVYRRFFYGN